MPKSAHESPLEALARELGRVAGRIEREASLRIDAAIADLRRIDAERELRLAKLERAVADRLASVRDGKDGAPGRDGKDGAPGEPGAPGRDGLDGKPGTDGKDGRDGLDGKPGADGTDGRDGVDGKDGAPGLLPPVKDWHDGVHYAGGVVTHLGATWQARCDTGRAPPHDDWVCIARAGRDGTDGRSFRVRGTWAAEATYAALDVVALGGAAFAARKDDPGPCPGEGWQLIASQGKRGKEGDRGAAGPRGERGGPGPSVAALSIDDQGMLTLVNADGTTVACDLYPLLSRLG